MNITKKISTAENSEEWLLSNAKGSFSTGSVDRLPRRKYHSLLTLRETPQSSSICTLLEFAERIHFESDAKSPITLADFDFGQGAGTTGRSALRSFSLSPGNDKAVWEYEVEGMTVTRSLWLDETRDRLFIQCDVGPVDQKFSIEWIPFLSMRPWHHLTHENIQLNGQLSRIPTSEKLTSIFEMTPYQSTPKLRITARQAKIDFKHRGEWYRGFTYSAEKERGYPHQEDAFCPGSFLLNLLPSKTKQTVLFEFDFPELAAVQPRPTNAEKKKSNPVHPIFESLPYAAKSYFFESTNQLKGFIAGYPWFESWGRDTMVCLPGFCFLPNQSKETLDFGLETLLRWLDIFTGDNLAWTKMVNPSGVDSPLLWIRAAKQSWHLIDKKDARRKKILDGTQKLIERYFTGLDPRVIISDEGLFVKPGPYASGWMDAVIDSSPVTPRWGFAVDLNALFIEAVEFLLSISTLKTLELFEYYEKWATKARGAFNSRFWLEEQGHLADLCDGVHRDRTLRPNQAWALAVNPPLLEPELSKRALEQITQHLLTPVGLRTLSPHSPHYRGKCVGTQRERDQAYHQGTVWPWLLGIYAEALVLHYGQKKTLEILKPVFDRLHTHLTTEGCLGQISEIFDGEAPHPHRGTPAQAWSVAELMRIEDLLTETSQKNRKAEVRS